MTALSVGLGWVSFALIAILIRGLCHSLTAGISDINIIPLSWWQNERRFGHSCYA